MMKADELERLLEDIEKGEVIPVIGQGLYQVEVVSNGKPKVLLLYDYLADQLLAECRATINSDENHRFAKACFEFLKKNFYDYRLLSKFLKKQISEVQLITENSLWKLARIKGINIFINTTYDDLLTRTIRTVRITPTEIYRYSRQEEKLYQSSTLFESLKNFKSNLVFHIFGNFSNTIPAYTENDILENIKKLLTDMSFNYNHLYSKLKNSSLLFIGCGYDDWLFRFFVRTLANNPYELPLKAKTIYYCVIDDFMRVKKDPWQELPRFLGDYGVEVFQYQEAREFVDRLFDEVKKKNPDAIISEDDFPGQVFISFEGKDRAIARCLADNLRSDGIDIWLDERKLNGGKIIDKVIMKAIDRCPVVIALISKNSKKIKTKDDNVKYHIQEWLRASSNKASGEKNVEIIPIKIDKTKWIFDKFNGITHLKIMGGRKEEEYGKLLDQLKTQLKQTH